ncbi:MAG TPA: XrtA system polysaccharide chain length determinant [Steroidobacter sp.]|uniref:XrtA system polysaccharide chain length determinant n=1 Tax=Steroidobacter sp. TaxID=1978227 RepID=UPI002EDADC4C
MQALIEKILNEGRGAWRFRRYALLTAWGVCLIGWFVVYTIPDTYQSSARVNVDTRTALSIVVDGLVVRPDVEAQLNLVRQTLLGRANLEKVAQQVGLDVTARTAAERQALLNSIISRIEIALEPPMVRDPRIPNTLFRISFSDSNRDTALKVVDVLLNSFVEDTIGSDRTGTASAERFLRDQLADYGRRLAESENRLAEFKKKNVGLVPGDEGGYFNRLTTEMQEVKRLQAALVVANSRRAELQRQLRGESPFVPPAEGMGAAPRSNGSNNNGPRDTATRIQETQSRLDDLLLRYTEKHPEVIATRETLDELKARQQQELAALRRGDPGAAALANASTNPIYQNIQTQLNQVDVEIAALRSQLGDRQRNESELRRLVDTAPEVEAEYARLTRDYDVTKAQYNTLLERLEKARLSGDAEQTGVVKFNIVDPPSAGFQPIFPNRPLFLFAVLVVGVGLGCGVAYLMHMLRPVFATGRTLGEVTGLPVLGTVTRSWVEKYRAQLRQGLVRYAAASALLFVVFVVVVVAQQPASRLLRQVLS